MSISSNGKNERQGKRKNAGQKNPAFDSHVVEAVWGKAKRQPGFETFAFDALGSPINRFDYGKTTEFGWVIDYVTPPARGGSNDVSNLQPVHWKNSGGTDPLPPPIQTDLRNL